MMKRLLLLLLLSMLMACQSSPADDEEEEGSDAVPVTTHILDTDSFVDAIEVNAVTRPIHEVRVSAEAMGRVVSAPFEQGQQIDRNALLLRVDADVDSARVQSLRSQVTQAQREYERTRMLAREGLATPQQLDQAESAVENAQLSLRQTQVAIGKTTVRSPMAGYVATKEIEVGEYVNPGQLVAHIVDYDTIVVDASVPEGEIRFISEGDVVEVFIPALEETFQGEVKRKGLVASQASRTFPVEIHIDNQDRRILAGMRARVSIVRERLEDVVTVSRDAILEGVRQREAMVLEGDGEIGKAQLRVVELGPTKGNRVVVRSGLEPGDRLIVKGHRGIVDGTLVRTVDETGSASLEPQRANAGTPDHKEDAAADE